MSSSTPYDDKPFVEKYRVVGTLVVLTVALLGFVVNSFTGVKDHGAEIERHNANHTQMQGKIRDLQTGLNELKDEASKADRWRNRQEPRIDKAATFADEWPKSGRLAEDIEQNAKIESLEQQQTKTDARLEKVEDRIWDKWTTQTIREAGS